MSTLIQDLRYGIRSLLRQPSFALSAVLTLALGVGATTAMFSVVNAVVLRPLPFPEPDRIVVVANYWTRNGVRSQTVSAPDFHDWKRESSSFSALAYWSGGETSVTVDGSAEYVWALRVTPGYFDVVGGKPALGRFFTADEERASGPLAAVITDAFWRRQFGARPEALGASLKYGDRSFTIVGVLEPRIRYPARADVYVPAAVAPETTSRSAHNYRVIGRLREGVTVAQAHAEMLGIAKRLEELYPNSNAGKMTAVVPIQEIVIGDTRQTLYILLAAVAVVLLIACANVANLLLARSTVREREMVVRAAVGAGRSRLIRQLLTESALLGLAAAVLGIWLARLGVRALVALAPPDLPRLEEIAPDASALLFALGIAVLASLLFGIAPALHVSRVQLVEGLRGTGKGTSTGARGGWARSAFVVAQVALAVVLVFGAGLLARSLTALASVDLGFAPDQLLVLRSNVPVRDRADAVRATAFYRDLLPEIRALPDVIATGAVTSLPTAVRSNGGYWIEGGPGPDDTGVRAPQALFTVATPEYFRTMRIPLLRGRDFEEGDRLDAPLVAIINASLARASFPDQDPIGRRIQCGLDSLEFMTIVGIVADVRTAGPATPPQPEIYMPYEQHPGPAASLVIVARTSSQDPLALVSTITRNIRQRNPDVPVRASTMESTLERASAAPRFRTFLLVAFAGVALVLAVAGVYGVMAYAVSQRVPELGVRIALGATPGNILGLIFAQGARLAAAGLVIGIGLALLSGRMLQGLLFGVTPRDPWMLASVAAAVAVATCVACYLPGRRAVRVDPLVALRAE